MSQTRDLISLDQSQAPYFVGLDLGGTNIKVGVVDDAGQTLSWLSAPTNANNGPEDAAKRMGEAVKQAIADANLTGANVARVGLGSPGPMDLRKGILIKPANLKTWDQFPIRDRVAHHCGLPVSFANDAGAAACGEYWIGSGREYDSMVLFTLGTGIGCGIIVAGQSIDGQHSHGAECGHIIINDSPHARMCGCGQRGHLEAYASATAVIKRTREALDSNRQSSLSKRLAEGAKLTPILVGQEAERGDQLSLEIILETARHLGVGTVNLMNTIDPDGVLFGGAMTFGGNDSELGRRFLAELKAEVRRRAFPVLAEKTVIEFASLGGDAGYIGAAGIARVDFRKSA